jgi:hypothetical protein
VKEKIKAKWAGHMTEVVEHLPSKHKALSSKTTTKITLLITCLLL